MKHVIITLLAPFCIKQTIKIKKHDMSMWDNTESKMSLHLLKYPYMDGQVEGSRGKGRAKDTKLSSIYSLHFCIR